MNNQPSARVLAHSINEYGGELITFEITCHRWILAEINTHRALSRNYRSSRAVPFTKLAQEVETNPAMPIMWMKNKPGMQATETMTEPEAITAAVHWRQAAKNAIYHAEKLASFGLHKQWVNRILEPYLFVHGVISGTEWANFFARRRAADAQPEFKALADAMWRAYKASAPTLLTKDEWHLPYVSFDEMAAWDWDYERLHKVSVARVARVSYKPFDGNADHEAEFKRHDKLLTDGHMSPFEHQARPVSEIELYAVNNGGNLSCTWVQYRKLIPGENITVYNGNDDD